MVGSKVALGKTSSAFLAKLISSKMPARFNDFAIRKHLAEKWCLGPSRQTAVLLFALASEPSLRLSSIKDAKHYWDNTASSYAETCGITLQVQLLNTVENISIVPAVDFMMEANASKSIKLATKQYKALDEFLQSSKSDGSTEDIDMLAAGLQQKMDIWTDEFSEDFLLGIAPVFEAKKIRRYNSWWNYVRQDVLSFYSGEVSQHLFTNEAALEAFINHLRSRANDDVLVMVRALAQQEHFSRNPQLNFGAISQRLQDAVILGVEEPPKVRPCLPAMGPRVVISSDGSIEYTEVPRLDRASATTYLDVLSRKALHMNPDKQLLFPIESDKTQNLEAHITLTAKLFDQMRLALQSGVTFEGKTVLITGASQGSIGAEVAQLLLAGGAHVIVTTSRKPAASAKYFQHMYEENGAKGSQLQLVQFNQASAKDCERLIDHIYEKNGLEKDLDAILPFAAVAEGGIEIDGIAAKSELVHRLMLTNVYRLLGRVIENKRKRGIDSHPTQILLPLSPNHGTFGGDGLYAESKLGLESLYNRVLSESWSEELSICGVRIGWTRSTGLMTPNNIISEEVEKHGVLTFSAQEMAFNIVILLTQDMVDMCEAGPVEANFSGGLDTLDGFHRILTKVRTEIKWTADVARAIEVEDERERACLKPTAHAVESLPINQRSTLRLGFPRFPDYKKEIEHIRQWPNTRAPDSTVVVVGYSELGPWGSSRLRWEMESQGKLSQSGYVEMAWLMNLIRHFDGQRKKGHYVGWVDTKTEEPVADADIEQKYGKHIEAHTGIRFVQPEFAAGYDPSRKEFLQEIAIEDDLPEFEVSASAAAAFQLKHGANVRIEKLENTETCRVQLKRGATIMVAKATPFTWGSVAGQLPTGWSATKYGIPEDLVKQLDPTTLYTICCVSEAFFSAGITDPLEIFKFIHLSDLGNCIGSSMGGALKTRNLYRDLYLEKEVSSDVLQDTYLNTTAAWINMLLLGAAGPIKTPVGACATGVESIDLAFDSIMSGKTKMCLVGGFDDFQEDESYGFAKMKATANAEEELAKGRLPSEMSRPTAESRAGFAESHGCGIQILCRADIALEMGLPIYGIIAGSAMASDKISRSVPAPGQGILTFAKEVLDRNSVLSAGLNSGGSAHSSLAEFCSLGSDYVLSNESISSASSSSWATSGSTTDDNTKSMSPLRASLAAWGLTIDDLDVASLHGTSTKANDKNETDVLCKQLAHLGRNVGQPLWAVCQKSVTGHPKAPAAAWMLNGCLQMIDSGLIPGNRNADNVDPEFSKHSYLCFPTHTVQTRDIKAFLLTSFGFGQKSGQVVGVAPRYLYATMTQSEFEVYGQKTKRRQSLAESVYHRALMSNSIVRVQSESPYREAEVTSILLDPLSRISNDKGSQSYRFKRKDINTHPMDCGIEFPTTSDNLYARDRAAASGPAEAVEQAKLWIEKRLTASTVGVDIVDLNTFTADKNAVFLARNYTDRERMSADRSVDARAHLASRWCAKEAVFKCLQADSKGAGAAMREIEIVSDSGVPRVIVGTNVLCFSLAY